MLLFYIERREIRLIYREIEIKCRVVERLGTVILCEENAFILFNIKRLTFLIFYLNFETECISFYWGIVPKAMRCII